MCLRRTGEYSHWSEAIKKIYKIEGPKAFWRGYVLNQIGIIPYAGFDLACYEVRLLMRIFSNHFRINLEFETSLHYYAQQCRTTHLCRAWLWCTVFIYWTVSDVSHCPDTDTSTRSNSTATKYGSAQISSTITSNNDAKTNLAKRRTCWILSWSCTEYVKSYSRCLNILFSL